MKNFEIENFRKFFDLKNFKIFIENCMKIKKNEIGNFRKIDLKITFFSLAFQ